ncbi:MAG: hypothetical protein COB14_04605 [Alphaproteobacteria bacterium]|nr:MAG: hypothetical protein COB14_04605 [Alphaproteobacteria bacterium]
MIEPDLSLQKPLEDYVEYIEKMNIRSLPLLETMSEPLFSFQDPYHTVNGMGAAQKILARRLEIYPFGRYRVHDFAWGRRSATAYIYWSFFYKVEKRKFLGKKESETYDFSGVSEVVFAPDGKILSHVEFWGGHDAFDVKTYQKPLEK